MLEIVFCFWVGIFACGRGGGRPCAEISLARTPRWRGFAIMCLSHGLIPQFTLSSFSFSRESFFFEKGKTVLARGTKQKKKTVHAGDYAAWQKLAFG
jgi:hypothetical protein